MKNTLKKLRTGVMVSLAGASFMVSTGVSANEQYPEGVVVTAEATTTEDVTAPGTEQVGEGTPEEAEEVATEPTAEELLQSEIESAKADVEMQQALVQADEAALKEANKDVATAEAKVTEAEKEVTRIEGEIVKVEALPTNASQQVSEKEVAKQEYDKAQADANKAKTEMDNLYSQVYDYSTKQEVVSQVTFENSPTQRILDSYDKGTNLNKDANGQHAARPILANSTVKVNQMGESKNLKESFDLGIFRQELEHYLNLAFEVNGMGSGIRVTDRANQIIEEYVAQYPNAFYHQHPIWLENHPVITSEDGSGLFTYTNNFQISDLAGSEKELAYTTVQGFLADTDNAFVGSVGHTDKILSFRDSEFGFYFKDGRVYVLSVYPMSNYTSRNIHDANYVGNHVASVDYNKDTQQGTYNQAVYIVQPDGTRKRSVLLPEEKFAYTVTETKTVTVISPAQRAELQKKYEAAKARYENLQKVANQAKTRYENASDKVIPVISQEEKDRRLSSLQQALEKAKAKVTEAKNELEEYKRIASGIQLRLDMNKADLQKAVTYYNSLVPENKKPVDVTLPTGVPAKTPSHSLAGIGTAEAPVITATTTTPSYSRVARAKIEKNLPTTGEASSLLSFVGLGLAGLGLTEVKRRRK